MKRFLLLFLLVAIGNVYSQNFFETDYALFYLEDKPYLEIYYSVDLNNFSTDPNSGIIAGELIILMQDSSKQEPEIEGIWRIEKGDETEIKTGLLRFSVLPGSYNLFTKFYDVNNNVKVDSIKYQLDIFPFDKLNFNISDIFVASNLKMHSNDKTSIFYKNSLEIIPNPSNIFGDNLPVLFFYSEIYNLNLIPPDQKAKVVQKLINSKNETVYSKFRTVQNSDNNIIEIGAIPVNKLSSGRYTLIISLEPEFESMILGRSKKVFVFNKNIPDTSSFISVETNRLNTAFSFLTEEEIDDIYRKSRYVTKESEKDIWKTLTDVEAKRKFISEFWQLRPIPFLKDAFITFDEYFKRVKIADDSYGNLSRKEGWLTDMGRVFILYGKPDKIDRAPLKIDTKPYEIWYYDNIESGVLFLFVDTQGFRDYRLVHSNKTGEIYDESAYYSVTRE